MVPLLSVELVVLGLITRAWPVVIVGSGAGVLAVLHSLLRGVEVEDGVLVFGPRWRRTRLPLAEVSLVEVGRIERLGLRGADVLGMVVTDRGGVRHPILESRYCSEPRLLAWSAVLQAECDGIEVRQVWRPMPSQQG